MAGELVPSDFTHGYYDFAGQVGGQILDLSGNGYHFTVNGAIDVSTGKFSNGLLFDGIDDYASSAQTRYADLTNQVGIFIWLKILRTATGVDSYFWKGTSGGTGQDLVLYSNNDTTFHPRVNDGAEFGSTPALGTTNHHLCIFNYDGSDARIYWDEINNSGSARSGNIRNTNDLVLGAITGNINNGNYIISQFGMRNSPFTADERSYLWNSGAGRLLATTGGGTNLLMMGVG